MVSSCTVWFVILCSVSFCNALQRLHSLFPVDAGMIDLEPFLTNDKYGLEDCFMRYLRYGKVNVEPHPPLPEYREPREYSHIAAIGWTRSSGTVDWRCMGTLILDSVVLTSAHCTFDEGNAAPDVVRLGGGNQFPDGTETNAEYIQQGKIKEVIRHPDFTPQTGQHDIAVLQLEKRITVNTTVAPACLWLAPETVFPKLESLGRTQLNAGATGQSSISSVETVQTNATKCGSSASRAGSAIQDSQLCVETVEECLDDPAGNPLQVRLLHNFKTSPFLVGIMVGKRGTNVGATASCSSTGVYTRIGSYQDWIFQVLNNTVTPGDFIPAVCGLRHVHVRPRVDELLLERTGEIPRFSVQVEGDHEDHLGYIVDIMLPSGARGFAPDHCAGTFVDQRTVLTLAECVSSTSDGLKPTEVIHIGRYSNMTLAIKSITVHPGYVRGSQANNIAVVKLEQRDDVKPACIWPLKAMPDQRVDLAGFGYSTLNNFLEDAMHDDGVPFLVHVLSAADHFPWENCTAELTTHGMNQSLQGLSANQHVCFRNDQWLVPGVCLQLPGGPVQRYIGIAGAFVKHVYALSLAGKSACGYGQPTVAILLEPHIPWLRSVMMDDGLGSATQRQNSPSDSVIVINPDLRRSDECSNGDGSVGICVPHEMCLTTQERLRKGERVTVCSVGSVVCCPWGDIARNSEVNPVRTELASCEARYRTYREQRWAYRQENRSANGNVPHVAEIGWAQNNGRIKFNCIGYLITTNTVITSAQCVESQTWKPTVARIGSFSAEDGNQYVLQPIRRVTVHGDYDEATGENNLAMVHLTAHITPTPFYFPGCLYNNATQLPVWQHILNFSKGELTATRIFPMYDAECRERTGKPIAKGQMCLQRPIPEGEIFFSTPCFIPGDLAVWTPLAEEARVDAEYLVGIFSHGGCREEDDVQIATRIQPYYDWIVDNIK